MADTTFTPEGKPTMIDPAVKLAANQNITVNFGSAPASLDPTYVGDQVSRDATSSVFDPLYRMCPDGKLCGAAATSHTISDDGLTWTFHLRPGATWQDGKPVTAQDFVYSWQRLMNPESAATYGDYFTLAHIVNAEDIAAGKKKPEELGVRAVDDLNLEVKLTQPVPWLDEILTYQATAPVRKDLIEKFGKEWTRPENIVGNGAYKLTKYIPNDRIEYVKWDKYWDATNVHITGYKAIFLNDPNASLLRYLQGELLVVGVPPSMKKQLRVERPEEIYEANRLTNWYLSFNVERIKDVRVRKAIALLTDQKFIVNNILAAGHATTIFAPTSVRDGQLQKEADWFSWPYEKRVEEANKLLAEAGVTPKNPLEIEFLLSNSRTGTQTFIAVQQQLQRNTKGALKVKSRLEEFKLYLESAHASNYDMRLAGWGADYNQASTFFTLALSNSIQNDAKYKSAEYDELVTAAAKSQDANTRAELYAKANEVLQRDVPVSILWWSTVLGLRSPALGGFNPNINDRFVRDYYVIDGKQAKPAN